MELIRKINAFISNPKTTIEHGKQSANKFLQLLRRRRLGAAGSFVVTGITDRSPYNGYIRYLSRRHGSEIELPIRDHRMVVNLDDHGMSRDLFLYGIREERTAETFERELRKLSKNTASPFHVLDIGANIGYYTLLEAAAIGETGQIIAFEPDPRNIPLLERNVERNGYDDRVTVEPIAVSTESGTEELQLSMHSNLNKIKSVSTTTDQRDADTSISVDVRSVDDYLDESGIEPDSIRAIRMDLEGFEAELLPSMESVLSSGGPLVLLVEMHPNILDESSTERLLSMLERHGFEVVAALAEEITAKPLVEPKPVDDFEDLRSLTGGYNLIVKKPVTEFVGDGTTPSPSEVRSQHAED